MEEINPPAAPQPTDQPDPTEAAWVAEIQRRRQILDAGDMPLHAWADLRAELLADR